MSMSVSGSALENQFRSPEVQKLLRHLRGDTTIEFKPAFNLKTGQITFPRAEEITGLDSQKVHALLDFLSKQGILLKEPLDAFYACPNCVSRNLILVSSCPVCNSGSLTSGRALEHLYCGNIDLEEAFMTKEGLKCPKCSKTLKAIGVDYRRMGTFYRCLSCKRMVEKPVQSFVCENCQKRTPYELSVLTSTYSYRVNPEGAAIIQKHALNLSAVIDVFEKHGFSTKVYTQVMGRSGVSHYADILAWYKKETAETEEKPDLLLDILILKEPLSEESMSAFLMKTIDIGSNNAMLVVSPRLSPPASKLASFYGIVNRSCESVDEIPAAMVSLLEDNLPRLVKQKLGEEQTQPPTVVESALVRRQPGKTEDQLAFLLAMIYEKQDESQKTMRKLLEYIANSDKRLESLLQMLRQQKAA